MRNKLFQLGQTVATPAALEAVEDAGQSPAELLRRHQSGDWGDLCGEDKQANDEAVEVGARILSVYTLRNKTKVWVITEADRSATTLLLAKEY